MEQLEKKKAIVKRIGSPKLIKEIWKYRVLYLILFPTIVYFLIFKGIPYYGLSIAFKDFSPARGIGGSEWVGMKYFQQLLGLSEFRQVFMNTLLISLYKLFFGFPVPIIFALLLNEVRHMFFKRSIQTITYFPHFLSWVIFGGIVMTFLTPNGVLPKMLALIGMDASNLLTSSDVFRTILVVTDVLKEFGWTAIIYLAALTGIDPHQYEAARMDGANRWRQTLHITIPGIRSTIVLLFILQLGKLLDVGFEQVFVLYNPTVYSVADIIDTYVYRIGLGNAEYSLATAAGMFKGVIGFILIVAANQIIKKMGEPTLW